MSDVNKLEISRRLNKPYLTILDKNSVYEIMKNEQPLTIDLFKRRFNQIPEMNNQTFSREVNSIKFEFETLLDLYKTETNYMVIKKLLKLMSNKQKSRIFDSIHNPTGDIK